MQGNLIRNLKAKRPIGTDPGDSAGVGISVGWGAYMRDVAVTSNVVRSARHGITLSVTNGAGMAIVSGNLISDTKAGAIVGMDQARLVTDLEREPTRYANLQVSGNKVR